MGGKHSEGYALFVQLTVKAFLAIRPHAEQMVDTVHLMLGTALPSFKGEGTIKRLRDRFVLGLGDREAADYMMSIIKNAHENIFSTVYDEFQRVSDLFSNEPGLRGSHLCGSSDAKRYSLRIKSIGTHLPLSFTILSLDI